MTSGDPADLVASESEADDRPSSAGRPPRAIILFEYKGRVYAARGRGHTLSWNRDVYQVPSPDEWPRYEASADHEVRVDLTAGPGDIAVIDGDLDAWWQRTGGTGSVAIGELSEGAL